MNRKVLNNDVRVKNAIIETLNYYSVFQMPLKADEIYNNLPVTCSFVVLLVGLVDLEDAAIIYNYEGYYSLRKDVRKLVLQRRTACN